MIPIYGIISFITIAFPNSYIYLNPWIDVFQSIALGSFFLLLCEFVSPSSQYRDVFFAALEVPQGKKGKQIGGLEWYRVGRTSSWSSGRSGLTCHFVALLQKRWFAVFQYPIVALGVAVATDITQAASVYCLKSNNIHFAHLWVSLPTSVFV